MCCCYNKSCIALVISSLTLTFLIIAIILLLIYANDAQIENRDILVATAETRG